MDAASNVESHLPAEPAGALSGAVRRRLALLFTAGLSLLLVLAGCTSVLDVRAGGRCDAKLRWALLPFGDFGETPQAGERAEELTASLMRVRWNIHLERYPATRESTALVDLNDRQRYEQALQWAREQGFDYGVAGSVQEWRYRNAAEGEAAVGLSLRVVHIKTGRPDWVASGAQSGLGPQTVSGIAERLLGKMINKMKMQ